MSLKHELNIYINTYYINYINGRWHLFRSRDSWTIRIKDETICIITTLY